MPLNRPLLQCNQDNGTPTITTAASCSSGSMPAITGTCSAGTSYRQWSYTGQTTDIYDEHRNHRQQTMDGLEQLILVKEPDSSNNPTLETELSESNPRLSLTDGGLDEN